MTIKVIERGTPKANQKYRTTCVDCSSVLEFLESDTTSGSDRNETYNKLKCPVCNKDMHIIYLESEKVCKD